MTTMRTYGDGCGIAHALDESRMTMKKAVQSSASAFQRRGSRWAVVVVIERLLR